MRTRDASKNIVAYGTSELHFYINEKTKIEIEFVTPKRRMQVFTVKDLILNITRFFTRAAEKLYAQNNTKYSIFLFLNHFFINELIKFNKN